MGSEVSFDLARQVRLGLREGFVEDDQGFMNRLAVGLEHIFQDQVRPLKSVLREEHPQFIADLNRTLDNRHRTLFSRFDGEFRGFI